MTSNTRADDWVPVDTVRAMVQDSGMAYAEIAAACGWFRKGIPDGPRITRMAGVRPGSTHKGLPGHGKPQASVRYATAVHICNSLNLYPVDYGL